MMARFQVVHIVEAINRRFVIQNQSQRGEYNYARTSVTIYPGGQYVCSRCPSHQATCCHIAFVRAQVTTR